MLETMYYENHNGKRIAFGQSGLYANENDLRDYTWLYEGSGGSVSAFNRGMTEKILPYVIYCEEKDALFLKNRLSEITEEDILNRTPGKFYIGDAYLECYIIANAKADYLQNKKRLSGTLTVLSLTDTWITRNTTNFEMEAVAGSEGKRYPYDYPYNYESDGLSREIKNDHYTDCDFTITIYGYVNAPSITIGDHVYALDLEIQKDEYVVIDSKSKTIKRNRTDGIIDNVFSYRKKDSYIFRKIPPGLSGISWNNQFGFDITIYKERSEPLWT